MDETDLTSSPRKKLKMDDASFTSTTVVSQDVTIEGNSLAQMSPDLELSKEEQVGITEFVSPDLPGFTGILKKRYTDFLVNEILPSGQVVHLDNLKAPKIGRRVEQSTQTEATSAEAEAKDEPNPESQARPEPITPYEDVKLDPIPVDASARQEPKFESQAHPEPILLSENIKLDPAPVKASATKSEIPEQVHSAHSEALEKWQAYASKPPGYKLTSEDAALLNSYFDAEVVTSLVALFNRVLNSPHRKPKDYGIIKSDRIADRELRTQIHQAIRRIFLTRLDSYTDNDGAMVISAAVEVSRWGTRATGGRNHGSRQLPQKGKPGWKELGGEYLHFSLYKENKDTMEVVSYLARQLKVKAQSFQFAGTKDRRAVTVQRVSIYRMHAERMVPLGRSLRNAKIGNYEYSLQGLELGELSGNEFIITLRDCQFQDVDRNEAKDRLNAATKIVEIAAKHLSERGFINYYGLQRFGTFKTRTDAVGIKMIQGDYKGAVEAILNYSPASLDTTQEPLSRNDLISSDDKYRAIALDSFKSTGKSHPALDDLPRKFSAEANLIRHLGGRDQANDYLGALQTIPRNLRLMYVHAYQSLVWNVVASERWKRYGDQLLTGDLVLVDEHKRKSDGDNKAEEIDADGEVIVRPTADDSALSAEDRFIRARALSKEEAESGKYTVFDIVLPTPGYDILYPANDLANFYKTFMSSERGGGLDPNDMRRQWKDVSLSGSYRKLIIRPSKEIISEVRSYTDDDEQFMETDVDQMQKRAHGDTSGHANKGQTIEHTVRSGEDEHQCEDGDNVVTTQTDQEAKPEKMAVILRLQLGSSQYATMALRELMKLGGVKAYKPDFGGGR